MGLFHFTLLALLACAFSQRATLELSRSIARQGEEVTMSCKVTGLSSDPNAEILIKINKYVRLTEVDDDTGKQKVFEQDLSVNTLREPPYDKMDRFDVNKISMGETERQYDLRISNLMPEDSAIYVCQIAGTEAYAAKEFQVYTMPDVVQFKNFSVFDRNIDVLHLEEGESDNVGCMAVGGVPKPRLEVVTGEINYTSWFKHYESEVILPECYDGTVSGCPLHYKTNSEKEAMAFRPFYKSDAQYMECRAHLDGSGMDPMVARIMIDMSYKPKFICYLKQKVALHTKKFQLKCSVMSNPGLEEVKFEYNLGSKTETLSPGQVSSDGEIQFLETKKISRSDTEVVLQFAEVFDRHYEVQYKLWARNELGQNSTNLELVGEDYVRGGADAIVYSGILALLACLLSIFMS